MMDYNYAGTAFPRAAQMMHDRVMARYDGDGSGDISLEEAGDRSRIANRFSRIDANDDGTISADELANNIAAKFDRGRGPMGPERMNAMAAWMQMQEANEQRVAAFDRIDTDADGSLSDAEIGARIEAMRAEEEAARLRQEKIAEVNRMDLDGDGRLSADELQAELDLRAENRAVAAFDALDTDADGALSDAELAAGIAADEAAAATVETVAADVAAQVAAPEEAAAEPGTAESATLTLIENIFEDMLEDRGESLSLDRLSVMSQALYAEAQEILIEQLEEAAEFAGEADEQDDDEVEYT